ncbi:MAG: DMT family transporter [Pseudomonadota bacterium]
MSAEAPRDNLTGGVWLIADMSLNIWALSIVKWLGAGYPATQIVLIRAATGLVLISPLIWRRRAEFQHIEDLGWHLMRVALAVITLSASFFAISRVPLAIFSAIGFTRPVVTMLLSATLLREVIGARQWMAAALAFAGVFVAANPGQIPWSTGLAALVVVVFTGSATTVVTRRLRTAPPIVMMTFYTAGLVLFTAPMALYAWIAVNPAHVLPLLLVGGFSQVAQLCFLRAHYHGEAGFLSVLSYLSLVLSVGVGILVFDETPTVEFALGAGLVIASALWVSLNARKRA